MWRLRRAVGGPPLPGGENFIETPAPDWWFEEGPGEQLPGIPAVPAIHDTPIEEQAARAGLKYGCP